MIDDATGCLPFLGSHRSGVLSGHWAELMHSCYGDPGANLPLTEWLKNIVSGSLPVGAKNRLGSTCLLYVSRGLPIAFRAFRSYEGETRQLCILLCTLMERDLASPGCGVEAQHSSRFRGLMMLLAACSSWCCVGTECCPDTSRK